MDNNSGENFDDFLNEENQNDIELNIEKGASDIDVPSIMENGGNKTGKHEKKEKTSIAADLFDWAEALVFALAILVIACAFIVRPSSVDGNSMYPTLHDKDQLLVSSFAYNEPKYGDVIVLMADNFLDHPLVKRVIGKSGDVVDIDFITGEVSVNGETLYEPYINEQTVYTGDVEFPFTVPEGRVFVMGDNRNASSDSRKTEVGTIPYEKIIGKVVFRMFPFNRMGTIK